MRQVEAYTALASIYDRVMDHVDYEEWAVYVDALLELHVPGAERVLELGAGTGRFAEELASLREVHLTLTDGSADMLERARERLTRAGIEARTAVLDFTEPVAPSWAASAFDAVLLLYDGFNYARSRDDAAHIVALAAHGLRPGGVFIFDQVTPLNSTNAENTFEDAGSDGEITYSRSSEYDPERRIHRTTFEIRTPEGGFVEEHIQRIWTPDEVAEITAGSPLEAVAAYDGYSLQPASNESERIHRVLQRP